MFAGKTVWEIFQVGGFTMYILLLCSFISVTILLERLLYYRKRAKTERAEFMLKIKRALKNVTRKGKGNLQGLSGAFLGSGLFRDRASWPG